jgi:hypothetical protein
MAMETWRKAFAYFKQAGKRNGEPDVAPIVLQQGRRAFAVRAARGTDRKVWTKSQKNYLPAVTH